MRDQQRAYFWKCAFHERKARKMHEEENSIHTKLELEHCMGETDYAFSRYNCTASRVEMNEMRGVK